MGSPCCWFDCLIGWLFGVVFSQRHPCRVLKSNLCVSSAGYPSTKDTGNGDNGRSVSLSSQESSETIVAAEKSDDKQETQFETRALKGLHPHCHCLSYHHCLQHHVFLLVFRSRKTFIF